NEKCRARRPRRPFQPNQRDGPRRPAAPGNLGTAQLPRAAITAAVIREALPARENYVGLALKNSNLVAVGVNSRGRSAAFPSLRPVPADPCRSPPDCLLT